MISVASVSVYIGGSELPVATTTTDRLSSQTGRGDRRENLATPRNVTLLNLVTELSTGVCEREVVAAVMDLIDTRQVRLIGQILEKDIQGANTRSTK